MIRMAWLMCFVATQTLMWADSPPPDVRAIAQRFDDLATTGSCAGIVVLKNVEDSARTSMTLSGVEFVDNAVQFIREVRAGDLYQAESEEYINVTQDGLTSRPVGKELISADESVVCRSNASGPKTARPMHAFDLRANDKRAVFPGSPLDYLSSMLGMSFSKFVSSSGHSWTTEDIGEGRQKVIESYRTPKGDLITALEMVYTRTPLRPEEITRFSYTSPTDRHFGRRISFEYESDEALWPSKFHFMQYAISDDSGVPKLQATVDIQFSHLSGEPDLSVMSAMATFPLKVEPEDVVYDNSTKEKKRGIDFADFWPDR